MDAKTRALIKAHIGLDVWEQGKARAKQLVAETAEAEKRLTAVQWSWGDLTLEIVPSNDASAPRGIVRLLLEALIDDYKLVWSLSTLQKIRGVCHAWPKDKRAKASFDAHKILAYHPDRFSLIQDDMTRAQALEIVGRRPVTTSPHKGATAIECAHAAKSFAKALARQLDNADVSDDLLTAVGDAWIEIALAADHLGILQELIDRLEEQQSGILIAA